MEVGGGDGRFGPVVGADQDAAVRDTAPGAVADEVEVVLDAFADEEGVELGARHAAAAEDVIRDGVDRCGFRP